MSRSEDEGGGERETERGSVSLSEDEGVEEVARRKGSSFARRPSSPVFNADSNPTL